MGVLAAARVLAACGSAASTTPAIGGGDTNVGEDAGAAVPAAERPCEETSECDSNRICLYSSLTVARGLCVIPTGMCEGPFDADGRTGHCYPGARCDGVGSMGRCAFTPASQAVFPGAQGTVTLTTPTDRTALTAMDGFSLQWEVSRSEPAGTAVVAAIMDAPPVLDPTTNRLQNTPHIRWIWSSADPGGAVQAGAVPLRFGARGLSPTGQLSAMRWGQDTLTEGSYWWFVYAIHAGEVVSSSTAQHFRVGPDRNPDHACTTVDQCVLEGQFPETAACVNGKCQRRCASDIDCAAVGSHCDFTVVVTGQDRHSGYCGDLVPVNSDAGTHPDSGVVTPDDASADAGDATPVPGDAGGDDASDVTDAPDAPI